jgi:hypothetical protein
MTLNAGTYGYTEMIANEALNVKRDVAAGGETDTGPWGCTPIAYTYMRLMNPPGKKRSI